MGVGGGSCQPGSGFGSKSCSDTAFLMTLGKLLTVSETLGNPGLW